MTTSAEMNLFVIGYGKNEQDAILNAVRRLKEKVTALSVEELAALFDGEIGHNLVPDELPSADEPETDTFGDVPLPK